MKKICLVLLLITLFAVPCFAESAAVSAKSEINTSLSYLFPKASGIDTAYGIEAQYVYWATPMLGFGGSVGYQKWSLEDEYDADLDFTLDKGDADLIPVGASVLFRPTLNMPVTLVFEGGLRYVINNYSKTWGDEDAKLKLEADNGILGVLALNGEIPINNNIKFLGGLGYQFDINKGDVKATISDEDESIDLGSDDAELAAFFLRAGIAISF